LGKRGRPLVRLWLRGLSRAAAESIALAKLGSWPADVSSTCT